MRPEYEPIVRGLAMASAIALVAGGVSAIGHDHSFGKEDWAAVSHTVSDLETRVASAATAMKTDLPVLRQPAQSVAINSSFEPNPQARTPGIDVSHFQGSSINWSTIAGTNIHFVYVKASQGDDEVDPAVKHNLTGLKSTNLHFGAYHFFDPIDDPIDQADHFLTVVGSLKGQLPPVLDVEQVATDSTPAKLQGAIESWLGRVKSKTGCEGMLYISPDFYSEHLGDWDYHGLIWLADYDAHLTVPQGVQNWDFWQHSQSGQVQGITSAVDLNWFAGDVNDLDQITCP